MGQNNIKTKVELKNSTLKISINKSYVQLSSEIIFKKLFNFLYLFIDNEAQLSEDFFDLLF